MFEDAPPVVIFANVAEANRRLADVLDSALTPALVKAFADVDRTSIDQDTRDYVAALRSLKEHAESLQAAAARALQAFGEIDE